MENVDIGHFMSDLLIVVMFLAGIVTTIGGATVVIKRWWGSSKVNKNSEILRQHTDQLNKLDNRIEKLENKSSETNEFTSVMCNSMLALLNHNINGNSKDKLEKAKEEMETYLIHRGE